MVQAQSGAEVEDFEGIARASTASPGRLPEDGMGDGMEPEPEPELADPYETCISTERRESVAYVLGVCACAGFGRRR